MSKSMEDENKKLIKRITKAKNNLEKLKEFFALNFLPHISSWLASINHTLSIQSIQPTCRVFSSSIFSVEELDVQKEAHSERILVKGKQIRDYRHLPALRQEICFYGMFMKRSDKEKVVEKWQVTDRPSTLKQMRLAVHHII